MNVPQSHWSWNKSGFAILIESSVYITIHKWLFNYLRGDLFFKTWNIPYLCFYRIQKTCFPPLGKATTDKCNYIFVI